MAYAGFWLRVVAAIIDAVIIDAVVFVLSFVIGYGMGSAGSGGGAAGGVGAVIGLVIGIAYFCGMESSARQATLGKMAVGIKVTDLAGSRISFGKALGRYLGKIVSFLILCIGFLMVAFTEKKQGLHDIMAGTLVVKKSAAPAAA
jgi:uncharacterized RDD family membrane protein YckC